MNSINLPILTEMHGEDLVTFTTNKCAQLEKIVKKLEQRVEATEKQLAVGTTPEITKDRSSKELRAMDFELEPAKSEPEAVKATDEKTKLEKLELQNQQLLLELNKSKKDHEISESKFKVDYIHMMSKKDDEIKRLTNFLDDLHLKEASLRAYYTEAEYEKEVRNQEMKKLKLDLAVAMEGEEKRKELEKEVVEKDKTIKELKNALKAREMKPDEVPYEVQKQLFANLFAKMRSLERKNALLEFGHKFKCNIL